MNKGTDFKSVPYVLLELNLVEDAASFEPIEQILHSVRTECREALLDFRRFHVVALEDPGSGTLLSRFERQLPARHPENRNATGAIHTHAQRAHAKTGHVLSGRQVEVAAAFAHGAVPLPIADLIREARLAEDLMYSVRDAAQVLAMGLGPIEMRKTLP